MKILIIKLSALGDAVMAGSMIKALRGKYPDCHITWLCGEEIAPLVELFDGVDEIYTVDNRLLSGKSADKIKFVLTVWKRLWGKRYDYCIVAHSDRRYKLLAATVLCGKKAYFRGRSGPIPGRYHGTDYARLALGIDGNVLKPYQQVDINISASAAAKDMVLLSPGGAKNAMRDDGLRRWPVQHYRELAEKLLAAGVKVGLIGAAADRWVEESFTGIPITSWIGKTDIPELLRILAGAKALVSHDSGPMHMSYLVKTPLVAIFGPVCARSRLPSDAAARALYSSLPCVPCYDGRNYAACPSNICMQEISADMVMGALAEMGVTRKGVTK